MNWEVDILDTSILELEGDFDAQVHHILSIVRLTAEKVHRLTHLFDDLEQAVQLIAPGCRVHPFGSVVTGLGIRTSDVDCYISLPGGMKSTVQHIIQTRSILQRYHKKFTQVFAITAAKVPIVKFVHIPTNCHCDVNFKSPAGVQNSKLIAFLLHWDSRALPLAILIKYWSKVHKFTGTNLLANYALIMMVIFYLQLMSILPSVSELQRNVPPYIIDNWNTAFDDSTHQSVSRNSDSLYELMGGFFKCYSTFNFKENIISPFIGRVISKKCFENFVTIPDEFRLYKEQVSKDVRKKLRVNSKICIQDVFEHNRNCSVAVHDKLAERIFAHIQFASKKFEEVGDTNFLRAILTPDPRNVPNSNIKRNYIPKHVFQNKVKKHKPKQRGTQQFNNRFIEMDRTKNRNR